MLRRGPWEDTARAQDPGWQAQARGGGLDKDASRELGRGGLGESGTRRSQNPQDTVDSVSGMRGKEESRRVHWFGLQDGQWCVCDDGKCWDSAGLGQRNGHTGWGGTAGRREGSGQGGAVLHTFSCWQHCPPAAWLSPGCYSDPCSHIHPSEAFPQAADPPRNALCQDLLPFSLGTEQHLQVSSLSKYVSPFPESNFGFWRASPVLRAFSPVPIARQIPWQAPSPVN